MEFGLEWGGKFGGKEMNSSRMREESLLEGGAQ